MLKTILKGFALFSFALIFSVSSAMAANPVGSVTDTLGSVIAQRDGNKIELGKSSKIFENDVILTDEGDYVEIVFSDDTYISLSGDGKFKVDEYAYSADKPESNKANFSILKSSFKYVSGKIGKQTPENVNMELDFVSVGIRGTTIYRTMENSECLIFLEEGKILVQNNAGSVLLNPQEGTKASDIDLAPAEPAKWSDEKIAMIKSRTQKPQ